jgi:F-type H+-transporting ATPase subunit c
MKKASLLMVAVLAVAALASPVMAEEAVAAAGGGDGSHWVGLARAFAIAIAVFGGVIGQSLAASRAVEGISRNPSAGGNIQTAMIIGLALIESLVLLAWLLIAFMIK